MVHAAPCHIGDVQQAIDTAEIDERAVIGDVLDHALDHIALVELADDFAALFGAGFFKDRAARYDDITAAAVHLEDLERLRRVHQRADIAHRAHIDLRAGQEGHGTAEIDREAALDATEDRTFDALGLVECFFKTVPGLFAAGLVAGEHRFALGVLGTVQIDLDFIADFKIGGLAGGSKFLHVDAAFHLEADIHDRLTILDRDHFAFDDGPFLQVVVLKAFVQHCLEIVHARLHRFRGGGGISHSISSYGSSFTGRPVVSGGLGDSFLLGLFQTLTRAKRKRATRSLPPGRFQLRAHQAERFRNGLLYTHFGCVEQGGVCGLGHRGIGAVRIACVALLDLVAHGAEAQAVRC